MNGIDLETELRITGLVVQAACDALFSSNEELSNALALQWCRYGGAVEENEGGDHVDPDIERSITRAALAGSTSKSFPMIIPEDQAAIIAQHCREQSKIPLPVGT